MKYIPEFHPFGIILRSKSVAYGFVTQNFTKEWKNRVYSRLSKMLYGFKDQARARPSGEKCELERASRTQADPFMIDRMGKFKLLGMQHQTLCIAAVQIIV